MINAMFLLSYLLPIEAVAMEDRGLNGSQENATNLRRNISVADWLYEEYAHHITALTFVMCIIIFKSIYTRLRLVSSILPESLILIVIGVGIGSIIRFGLNIDTESSFFNLTPTLFFDFLLPPIVLECAYSIYNRTFAEYLGIILIYAVLGTILNFIFIGFSLYLLETAGALGVINYSLGLKGYLLFSSLIIGVDPVAVLAIFQDIGVDLSLYYMVFGESLLNDAVTVVLYMIMSAFCGMAVIEAGQIVIGVVSFFTISFGGLLIGILFGVLTCLLTKYGNKHELSVTILLGYMSYIFADMLSWSGIISMIGCGLVQAAYAFHNMSINSLRTLRKITAEAAIISEAVIFAFIGVKLLNVTLVWHSGFCLWALVICLLARSFVVMGLAAIINWIRLDNYRISFTEQIILIYGGLRGAVALSLALLIDADSLEPQGTSDYDLIVTTTLFIILVTVGFMGVTMKPLVKMLGIKMERERSVSILETLNQSMFDQCLAGIEAISGSSGRNQIRIFWFNLDIKYIRPCLQRDPETQATKLIRVYERIALKLHFATIQPSKSSLHLDKLPNAVKENFYKMSTISYPMQLLTSVSTDNLIKDEMPILKSILRSEGNESKENNYQLDFKDVRKIRPNPLNWNLQPTFSDAFMSNIRTKAKLLERRATVPAGRSRIGTTSNQNIGPRSIYGPLTGAAVTTSDDESNHPATFIIAYSDDSSINSNISDHEEIDRYLKKNSI